MPSLFVVVVVVVGLRIFDDDNDNEQHRCNWLRRIALAKRLRNTSESRPVRHVIVEN